MSRHGLKSQWMTGLRAISLLVVAVGCGLFTMSARAEIVVGPDGQYRNIGSAVLAARPGETLRIRAGTYSVQDVQVSKSLTMIGDGTVIFTSGRPVEKGLLVPLSGVNLTVENITFDGARSVDRNGAGIRFEGATLTIRNCVFRHNEDGILATGDADGEISITGSRFFGNGAGDGYSHGIYINRGSRLTIANSVFEGTYIGHHVKSMTDFTYISNSNFLDGDGEASYMVDVTNGGMMILEDNDFTRTRTASQDNFLNYDTSRGGSLGRIALRRNVFRNEKPGANLLRNPENAPLEYAGNQILNAPGASLREPGTIVDFTQRPEPQNFGPPAPEELPDPIVYSEEDLSGLTPMQRAAVLKLQQNDPSIQQLARTSANDSRVANAGPVELTPREEFLNDPVAPQPVTYNMAQPRATQIATQAVTQTDTQAAPQISSRTPQLIGLPEFLPRSGSNDIVGVNLAPLARSASTTMFVTFGQAFRESAVFPGDNLALRLNGEILPVQSDVKATWPNGSVRHAVLSAAVPRKFAGAPQAAMLIHSNVQLPADEKVGLPASYALTVVVEGRDGAGKAFSKTVNLASRALSPDTRWLDGPLVSELSVSEPMTELLTLVADIRVHADGVIRTAMTFENHKSFSQQPRDLTYTVRLTDGAQVIETIGPVKHYRAANWTKEIWQGGLPAFDVVHDSYYLRSAFAIPPLDLTIPVSRDAAAALIERDAAQLRQPLSGGLIEPYMPATGGRDDIGMVPNWAALYLKTQSPLLKEVMLNQADAAGAVPWHMADDATGEPIRADYYPNFWADSRGANETGGGLPKIFFEGSDGGWTPDLSHKPATSYVPYLVTGDAKYRRALSFEAAWAIISIWPEERLKGPQEEMLVSEASQPRARAWALRDISDAAFILPDTDAMKSYFEDAVKQNTAHLFQSYVVDGRMDAAGEAEGWFDEATDLPPGRISPWQNDYIVMALGLIALRGDAVAGEVVAWTENWQTGRFLAKDANPRLGPIYAQIARNPQTGKPFTTWREIMQVTARTQGATETYASDGAGFIASACGALAMINLVTGSEASMAALRVIGNEFEEATLFRADNPEGVYDSATMIMGLWDGKGGWASIFDVEAAQ